MFKVRNRRMLKICSKLALKDTKSTSHYIILLPFCSFEHIYTLPLLSSASVAEIECVNTSWDVVQYEDMSYKFVSNINNTININNAALRYRKNIFQVSISKRQLFV